MARLRAGCYPPWLRGGDLVPVVYRQENSSAWHGTGSVSTAGSTASNPTIDAQSIYGRQAAGRQQAGSSDQDRQQAGSRLQAGYRVWLFSCPDCLSWQA